MVKNLNIMNKEQILAMRDTFRAYKKDRYNQIAVTMLHLADFYNVTIPEFKVGVQYFSDFSCHTRGYFQPGSQTIYFRQQPGLDTLIHEFIHWVQFYDAYRDLLREGGNPNIHDVVYQAFGDATADYWEEDESEAQARRVAKYYTHAKSFIDDLR